jgi:hypothetical protein
MFIWEYPSRLTVSQAAQQKAPSAIDGELRFTNPSVTGSLRNLFRFVRSTKPELPKGRAVAPRECHLKSR